MAIGDQREEIIYIPTRFIDMYPRLPKGSRRHNKTENKRYVLTAVSEESDGAGGIRRQEIWTEIQLFNIPRVRKETIQRADNISGRLDRDGRCVDFGGSSMAPICQK